jgi:branched-chain amino acid transport system substrate-binding protein
MRLEHPIFFLLLSFLVSVVQCSYRGRRRTSDRSEESPNIRKRTLTAKDNRPEAKLKHIASADFKVWASASYSYPKQPKRHPPTALPPPIEVITTASPTNPLKLSKSPTRKPSAIKAIHSTINNKNCEKCRLTIGVVAWTPDYEGNRWTYNAVKLWQADHSVAQDSPVVIDINGTECEIKIIFRDSENNATKTTEVTKNLIYQDEVLALVGFESSSVAIAAANLASSNNVSMLSTTATHPNVTAAQTLPFAFRMGFTDDHQSYALVLLGRKVFNAWNVAVIFLEDDVYSSDLATSIRDAWETFGSVIYYTSFHTADVKMKNNSENYLETQLGSSTFQNNGAPVDIVFLPIPSQYIPQIVAATRRVGWKGPILGGDSWDDATALERCGQPCIGAFYTSMWAATSTTTSDDDSSNEKKNPTTNTTTQSFIERYRRRYNQFPHAMAALAYDAISLVADAWKRVVLADDLCTSGTTNRSSISSNRIQLNEALRNTSNFSGITSGNLTLDNQNNPMHRCVDISYVSVNITPTYFYSVCPR